MDFLIEGEELQDEEPVGVLVRSELGCVDGCSVGFEEGVLEGLLEGCVKGQADDREDGRLEGKEEGTDERILSGWVVSADEMVEGSVEG